MKIIIVADSKEAADWVYDAWVNSRAFYPEHCGLRNAGLGFAGNYDKKPYGYKLIAYKIDEFYIEGE